MQCFVYIFDNTECTTSCTALDHHYRRQRQQCTFLDALRAFSRVEYCQVFHLLTRCCLHSVILYFCIICNRVMNAVQKGGVLSAVTFCVYIDELLLKLTCSGVGCRSGKFYLGADDSMLLRPSASTWPAMLFPIQTGFLCERPNH